MKNCPGCGAKPGAEHGACNVARCTLCGGQRCSCTCVYRVSGLDPNTLEETHPEIYKDGATDEMWARYDAEVAKYGGPLPWTGEWPGDAECREFGWWVKMVPGKGWTRCAANEPEATQDLNRLYGGGAWWSKEQRGWLRRQPS